MARRSFGGTAADFVSENDGDTIAGGTGTVWTAQHGGTQITDLLDADDVETTTLTASSSPRGLVQFSGPDDGTNVVWVSFQNDGSQRVKMVASDGFSSLEEVALKVANGDLVYDPRKESDYHGNLVGDDTAAIQRCITTAEAALGGFVLIPDKSKITATLAVTSSNVTLIGFSTEGNHDTGTMGMQTRSVLTWYGADGGTMVKFSPTTGASAQRGVGGGVKNIMFNRGFGSNRAGVGLHVQSWAKGNFENLFFYEQITAAILVDCLDAGSLGEAHDTQENRFVSCSARLLTGGGTFLKLDGNADASANASLNYFENLAVTYTGLSNVGAYALYDCDNNLFMRCKSNFATSGDAVVCHAATDGGTARYNVFFAFSGSGNIKIQGTDTSTNAAHDNAFLMLDGGNGTPAPTLGTGADANWSFATGVYGGSALQKGAVGENSTNALAAQAAAAAGTGSFYVYNSSSNHTILSTADGSMQWGININGATGDLRLTRIAGAGKISFPITVGLNGVSPPAWPTAYTQTYSTASRTHPAATSLAAPAGGTGTAAGGWDTAANRDAAIATINALRTDLDNVKQLLNSVIDDLQLYGVLR